MLGPMLCRTLPDHEVHVVDGAVHAECADAAYAGALDDDERARADGHDAAERAAFVVARATLRCRLGDYLGCAPSAVRFSYGPRGKPELAPDLFAASRLHFNVSHAGDRVLLAFGRGRDVGIDIERIRPEFDIEAIGRRFFSDGDLRALDALPPGVRHEALFHGWARKEAFVKAVGAGLSMPLAAFQVDLRPDATDVALRIPGEPDEASRWSLLRLHVGAGYAGALAVRGHGWSLHWR
jgi:4'-phosphopantetheinyl transferase